MQVASRGSAALDRVLDAGVLISLAALIAIFASLAPQFLTVTNFLNILDSSAIVGIVAVGMTIALIAGQFTCRWEAWSGSRRASSH